MDEFSLCCLSNRGLLCGSISKELHLDIEMLAGCKFIVIKYCLMNREKAHRSVLAITLVYVVNALRCSTEKHTRVVPVNRGLLLEHETVYQ